MATTTNFGWDTPDDTDLVKDGAAAIRTLGNSIDTSFVDLKGGTTNQVLAKNSNTDLDFKWVADATGIPATIIDAKGDLIAGTAADTAGRLAVGTNGHVLTADSGETTGIKWAAIPATGWTLISTTTLGAANVTLSSIPQTYKHLALIGIDCYGTNATYTLLRFNNWSSGDYYYQALDNSSSTVTQAHYANSGEASYFISFSTSANHQTTPHFIYNYASTTLFKQYTGGSNGIDSGGLRWGRTVVAGEWRKTDAITELNLVRSSTQTNVGTVQLWGIS